jgi:polyisoprenoid-binding protein YceI
MKLKIAFLFLGLSLLIPVSVSAETAVYTLDVKTSHLTFYGDTPLHKFEGTTNSLSGDLRVDIETRVVEPGAEIRVPVESFHTGNQARDHAVAFTLNAKKQSQAVFRVKAVTAGKVEGRFRVKGSLRLACIEKEVEFDAAGTAEADAIEINAEFPLSIKMFELKPPPLARMIGVRDRVSVKFHTRWLKRA